MVFTPEMAARRLLGREPRRWCSLSATYRRELTLAALVVAMVALWGGRAPAVELTKATTSRSARDDAIASIPFEQIDERIRGKVATTVHRAEVFRRMPVQVVDCDPAFFLLLVRRPEIVINIWQVMSVTKISMTRQSDTLVLADDGAGTQGQIEYVHVSPDTHVLFADGSYSGSLLSRPVRGECVLVLKCSYHRGPDGQPYINCRLDAFVDIHNTGLEIVAKGLNPVMGSVADHNFRETTAFVASLGRAAERNPDGVGRLCQRLTRVEPVYLNELMKVSQDCARRAGTTTSDTAPAKNNIARQGN